MIVLILQIVLIILQWRVQMGRKPITHEIAYACWHNRHDMWALFKMGWCIMDAQFKMAMRQYDWHEPLKKWFCFIEFWIIYTYIIYYLNRHKLMLHLLMLLPLMIAASATAATPTRRERQGERYSSDMYTNVSSSDHGGSSLSSDESE